MQTGPEHIEPEKNLLTSFGNGSQHLLLEALDQHAAIIITDAAGKFTYVNANFCRISQYSQAELKGQNYQLLKSPLHNETFWSEVWKRISQGQRWQGEICHRAKDGSLFWLDTSISVETDTSGQALRYIALQHDITETKLAEQSYAAAQETLQEASRIARIGSWEYRLTPKTLTWSQGTKQIHEVSPDFEPELETAIEFYEQGWSRKRIRDLIHRALQEEENFEEELQIRTAKGNLRWVKVIIHSEFVNGQCQRIYGIFQDVEKEKAERLEHEETNAFLNRLLDAATEFSIISTDLEGRIRIFNYGAEKLLGYSRKEVVGTRTPTFIHLQSEIETRSQELTEEYGTEISGFETFVRVARDKGIEVREWTYVRKNGSRVPVTLTVTPMQNQAGALIGYLGIARNISIRKQTQKSLLDSEQRWQFALEGSGDGVWDWNARNNTVYYSRRWKALLGYEEHEIGDSFEEWESRVHPDDLEACKAALSDHFAKRTEIYINEHRIRCKDGTYKWVLDRGKVVNRDADGKPMRIIGTHTDITERKNFQKDLETSERRFRSSFEGSGIGMAIVGLDGKWQEVNLSVCKILGYSENVLLTKTFQDITHPEDLHIDLQYLQETIEGKRSSYQMVKRYFHSDARIIWVRLTVSLIRDADGKPLHFVSQLEDITERKELEEQVGKISERLSIATRSSGIGIWDWDMVKDRFVWDNQMKVLFDFRASDPDPNYQLFRDRVHPDDVEYLEAKLKDTLENDADYDLEFRIRLPNGKIRHIWAIGILQRDTNGKPVRMVGTNRDITQNVKQREDLARLAKEAESASQSKSEFLANMSHEIRTPLNGIIGMTSILSELPDISPEQGKYIEIIQNSGRALLTLINDILDFAKIEAGKLDIEHTDFSLHTLLEECVALPKQKASEKGLTFRWNIAPECPDYLIGDPNRLRQILINLSSNAIKFTENGSVRVFVDCLHKTTASAKLRFSVIDTGIGINKETRDKLFQQFTQADSSISREYGGTGLGLAISKQLVDLMGGEIDVKSDEGIGSVFWFSLQLPIISSQKPETNTKAASKESLHDSLIEAFKQKEYKVLLVEDNLANQMVLQGVLKKFGLAIEIANNGLEALEALKTSQYDLVFMDIQMPKMDGMEASRCIRDGSAGALNQNIPIIAVTAHARMEDRENCLQCGMNDYVTKPINRADLVRAMSKQLLPELVVSEPEETLHQPEVKEEPQMDPIFDSSSFFELTMGDRDLAVEVIKRVLKDMRELAPQIQTALQAEDYKELTRRFHTAKGFAMNTSCPQLAKIAHTMERAAKKSNRILIESTLPELESVLEQTIHELTDYIYS